MTTIDDYRNTICAQALGVDTLLDLDSATAVYAAWDAFDRAIDQPAEERDRAIRAAVETDYEIRDMLKNPSVEVLLDDGGLMCVDWIRGEFITLSTVCSREPDTDTMISFNREITTPGEAEHLIDELKLAVKAWAWLDRQVPQ